MGPSRRGAGNPPSNIRSLNDRIRNHAASVGVIEVRVRRRLAALVVNEMFLGVDIGIEGPPVLVKGGTAIDLRRGTSPARLSRDWDGSVRGNLEEFAARARISLEAGWCGFTGRMTPPTEIDVPGLSVKPRRFEVKLDYHGKPFATVPVELSPVEAGSGREYDHVSVTEYSSIGIEPGGPVYCLSLRYQIAQKIHACTDPLDGVRANDRARDLADLQLLAMLVDESQFGAIHAACKEIFEERGRHQWPPEVRVWPSWPSLYAAAITNLTGHVHDDIDQAVQWFRGFIDALDAATLSGK